MIYGYPGRLFGAGRQIDRTPIGRRPRRPVDLFQPLARQAGNLDPAQAHLGRHLGDAIGDADRAEMLEARLGEADRARMRRAAAMLFDENVRHAPPGEKKRCGQPDEAAADDDDGCSFHG